MKKRLSIILTGLVLTGLVSGCGAKATAKSENVEVRVGLFPNITHAQALVGKNNGKFQELVGAANKISWKQFNAGSAEVEAFLAGEIDLGYIGPGPAINGFIKSKGDIVVIAGVSNNGAILVAGKDSGITSVKDLKGKKVAIPQFGNTQDLSLRAILKDNNLKDTTKGGDVEIVVAENPDIKTLLDKKEIAAALVPEPWGSRLVKESNAKIILEADKVYAGGEYPVGLIVVRKEFLEKHRKIVKNFLKAHVELTDYLNTNPKEAADVANKEIKVLTGKDIAKDILDTSFSRVRITYKPEVNVVNEFAKLSFEVGFLKTKGDTSNLFDLTVLNEVLKEKNKEIIK